MNRETRNFITHRYAKSDDKQTLSFLLQTTKLTYVCRDELKLKFDTNFSKIYIKKETNKGKSKLKR